MKLKASADPEAADAAPEKRVSSETPQSPFERVLDEVGGEGRYQILLLFAYLLPLSFYSPFGSSSLLLMMTTPDHSCSVPGRPSDLIGEEEWRNMTIPWCDGSASGLDYAQLLSRKVLDCASICETILVYILKVISTFLL